MLWKQKNDIRKRGRQHKTLIDILNNCDCDCEDEL